MIMNMDDGHKEIEEFQQMSGIFKIMVILLVRTKTGQFFFFFLVLHEPKMLDNYTYRVSVDL